MMVLSIFFSEEDPHFMPGAGISILQVEATQACQ